MQDSPTCSSHHENNIEKSTHDKVGNTCTASQTKNGTSERGDIGSNVPRSDVTSHPTMIDDKMTYCLVYEYHTLGAPVEIHPEYMDIFS